MLYRRHEAKHAGRQSDQRVKAFPALWVQFLQKAVPLLLKLLVPMVQGAIACLLVIQVQLFFVVCHIDYRK